MNRKMENIFPFEKRNKVFGVINFFELFKSRAV